MFSMDSVLLCSCACVSVGVMLRLVIAPGSYCGCVDVSFFPFLYFNPSLSVCTPLSFMEIFAIRYWLILNKQPEKCCCHHLARGKKSSSISLPVEVWIYILQNKSASLPAVGAKVSTFFFKNIFSLTSAVHHCSQCKWARNGISHCATFCLVVLEIQ